MIESGSLTPGVSAADFGLPPETALRYEIPAPALADYFNEYHVFDSAGRFFRDGSVDWMLPAWPAIRVVLADNPISLRLGNRHYDPLPTASLYGTTTRAMEMTAHGGVTIGAAISPLGWSRLFKVPADAFRDRIVPLAEVMRPAIVDELVATLRRSDHCFEVKPLLDDFFRRHLLPIHRDEPTLRQIAALIADENTADLISASNALGIEPTRLRRLSSRFFGYPPKTLLNRTRFLRAFLRLKMNGGDYRGVRGYFDASHFLRDAQRYLGMTPRQFIAMPTPYLDANLRARRLVLRAARQSANRDSAHPAASATTGDGSPASA